MRALLPHLLFHKQNHKRNFLCFDSAKFSLLFSYAHYSPSIPKLHNKNVQMQIPTSIYASYSVRARLFSSVFSSLFQRVLASFLSVAPILTTLHPPSSLPILSAPFSHFSHYLFHIAQANRQHPTPPASVRGRSPLKSHASKRH